MSAQMIAAMKKSGEILLGMFAVLVFAVVGSALVLIFGGCSNRVYRVRSDSTKTSILVFERQDQASERCRRHIDHWKVVTGRGHLLDDGTPSTSATRYRGCLVPPKSPGGYYHIIASLETIDVVAHEICHRLGADPKVCDEIHFDGRYYPGRTVEVP